MHEQFRPQAEKRAKSLLVLSEIARVKGVEVSDAEIEAEVEQARTRYATDKNLVQYFDSERGRNYIRSTIRRSRTVESSWTSGSPPTPTRRASPTSRTPSAASPSRRPLPAPRTRSPGQKPGRRPQPPAVAAAGA